MVLCACSGVASEWQAAQAAQKYYEGLAEGNVSYFLSGKFGIDSMPADFREQLQKAVQLYRDDIERKHGGLRQVLLSDNTIIKADTLHVDPYVKAFLILCYTDSTEEEVVVPMVETTDGEWRMK